MPKPLSLFSVLCTAHMAKGCWRMLQLHSSCIPIVESICIAALVANTPCHIDTVCRDHGTSLRGVHGVHVGVISSGQVSSGQNVPATNLLA